jgi:hypothetical protein
VIRALVLLLLLAPGVAAAAAPVHAPTQQLVAPMRAPGDQFGAAIAVEGDVAVISAPTRAVGVAPNAGEFYTLRRSNDAWMVLGSFGEPAYATNARVLGRSLALRDNLLLLGAPGYSAGFGAAFLYGYDGVTPWVLAVLLTNPMPQANTGFGVAVGLSGGQALVGETILALPPSDGFRGRVHVYDQSAGWAFTQTLTSMDDEDGDRFGYAIALDGDTAVIGAPGKEGARGAAYVFTRTGEVWSQAQKLVIVGDRMANDFFGAAVAISGDHLLVGAFGRAGQQGAAYVFRREDGKWSQLQELLADPPMPGEVFGGRVALRGERALVSGWGFGFTPMIGPTGGAYLYGQDPAGYHLLAALRTPDGVPGDNLGLGAALSDREVFLGAPYDDAPALPNPDITKAPGAAYVFSLAQAPGEPCLGDGDCASGGRCCDLVCVAVPVCEVVEATSSGGDDTSSSGPGPTDPTTGEPGSSSGEAPAPQFVPGDAGCACDASDTDASGFLMSTGSIIVMSAMWAGVFGHRRRRRSPAL